MTKKLTTEEVDVIADYLLGCYCVDQDANNIIYTLRETQKELASKEKECEGLNSSITQIATACGFHLIELAANTINSGQNIGEHLSEHVASLRSEVEKLRQEKEQAEGAVSDYFKASNDYEALVARLRSDYERLIRKADDELVTSCNLKDELTALRSHLSEAYDAILVLWKTPDSTLGLLPTEQLNKIKSVVLKIQKEKL